MGNSPSAPEYIELNASNTPVVRVMNQSSKRVARSYAPIGVKVKALGIEVSALKRSRLARERRLEGSSSIEIDSEE